MSNQNEGLPFVVIEEMIADHSLAPEDIALNFEFFQHLSENNNKNPRQNERQPQNKRKEKQNVVEEIDSSELLIKTMLEDDGLDPQEIEKIVQEMHESAVVPPKEEEWQYYDEKAFEEENIEHFPENDRDIVDENVEYAPKHEIPDEMKFILEELTNERDKEQESLKLIDKMLAEELQEKDKKIEEEEKASEKFINNMLEEEEKKEEEKQPATNCPICLDNLFSQAVFPLYNCKHMFHIECLESYVIEEIKKRVFPIRCPHPECKKEIPEDDVKDTLQAHVQYQDIYDEYYIKSYVESNPDQFLHCPTPNCNFVFCLDEGPRFNCPECQKSHCMNCKVEWHNNLTCEQYAEQKKNEGDDYFMKLADQMKYKRCPKCKIYVERIQGCNAMTCSRCHTMFCYECGKQGDGHVCNHKIDPPPSQNEPFSLKKMLFG